MTHIWDMPIFRNRPILSNMRSNFLERNFYDCIISHTKTTVWYRIFILQELRNLPLNHVEIWHAKLIVCLTLKKREKNKTFLNAFGKYQLFNKMRNIYKFREINCISWNFGIFTFSCYQTNLPNLFFHFVYFGSKSFCSSIQQNSDLSREIFNGKDWDTRRRFTAWNQIKIPYGIPPIIWD